MLLAPLLLLLVIPQWLAPPWLNGFVGVINVAVAFMLAQSRDVRRHLFLPHSPFGNNLRDAE
jgi:hypothetical protein